jgi:hypothetical protein
MSLEVAIKALAIWVTIVVLAVANGAVRETVLIPNLDGAQSLILSGLILCGVIFVVAYLSLPWLGVHPPEKWPPIFGQLLKCNLPSD